MSPGMAWTMGFVCLAVGLTPVLQVVGFFPIAPDSSRWLMLGVGALFSWAPSTELRKLSRSWKEMPHAGTG